MRLTRIMVVMLIAIMLPLACHAGDMEEYAIFYPQGFRWRKYPGTLKLEKVDGPGLVRGAICREVEVWGQKRMVDFRFEAEVKKSFVSKAFSIKSYGVNNISNVVSMEKPTTSVATWTANVDLRQATGRMNTKLARAFLAEPEKPVRMMEGRMSLAMKYSGSSNTSSLSKAMFIPVSELKH